MSALFSQIFQPGVMRAPVVYSGYLRRRPLVAVIGVIGVSVFRTLKRRRLSRGGVTHNVLTRLTRLGMSRLRSDRMFSILSVSLCPCCTYVTKPRRDKRCGHNTCARDVEHGMLISHRQGEQYLQYHTKIRGLLHLVGRHQTGCSLS